MIGWPLAFAWAFACRCGDSSQQATCPHSRHIRRCSQGVPAAKHCSHPSTDSGSRLSLIWARCPHVAIPTQGRTNTDSRDSHGRAISKCRHATRRHGERPVAGAPNDARHRTGVQTPGSDRSGIVMPRDSLARVRRAGVAADPRQVGACGSGLFPAGRSEGHFKSTASWARPSRAAPGSARVA